MSKQKKLTVNQKRAIINILKFEEYGLLHRKGIASSLEDEQKINILQDLFILPLKELQEVYEKYIF